jgi:hypothetical protein
MIQSEGEGICSFVPLHSLYPFHWVLVASFRNSVSKLSTMSQNISDLQQQSSGTGITWRFRILRQRHLSATNQEFTEAPSSTSTSTSTRAIQDSYNSETPDKVSISSRNTAGGARTYSSLGLVTPHSATTTAASISSSKGSLGRDRKRFLLRSHKNHHEAEPLPTA